MDHRPARFLASMMKGTRGCSSQTRQIPLRNRGARSPIERRPSMQRQSTVPLSLTGLTVRD